MAKQGELDVSHLLAEGASNHHLARAQTAGCSLPGRSHQARKRCDEVGSLSTSRTGKRPALSVSDTSLAFPHSLTSPKFSNPLHGKHVLFPKALSHHSPISISITLLNFVIILTRHAAIVFTLLQKCLTMKNRMLSWSSGHLPLGEACSLFDTFEIGNCCATPSIHSKILTGINIQSALNIGSLNTLKRLRSPSLRIVPLTALTNHLWSATDVFLS
jgi:hypothetical protein